MVCENIWYTLIINDNSELTIEKILIKTDHKSLEWLKESKIPRLIRWACRLEEFDYEIDFEEFDYDMYFLNNKPYNYVK